MTTELYAVVWRYGGHNNIVDFDDLSAAQSFAVLLTETGTRDDVLVSGPREVEIDTTRMAALKDRILKVVRTAHVEAIVREAAGGET